MIIGYGWISLRIPQSGSLKAKRSVLNKVIKRAQNEFNVSIAQVGRLDDHQFARIGFAMTGNEQRFIEGKIDHLLHFIENLKAADVLDSKVEIMSVSDIVEEAAWVKGKYDEF
ncbi:MAG TPA: DUF503 domain-containing protein [Smithellaceae bacterium]|nr:DUF503 domain-containing protein [Smithellaceae bacterium]HRS81892.1 DUF503 domain-containing protein [Smithellaceae bacterium]HRV44653.1 DUF503 domain-containing protein [Smithellaceae bacterium]